MYNYHEITDNEYFPNYTGYNEMNKSLGFVGNFTFNHNDYYVSGVLLKLDDFDINLIVANNIQLKDDEILSRYVTDKMLINGRYYQKPLVKINRVKGLIYFLMEDDLSDKPIFEKRGVKLNCLNIIIAGVYNNHMRDCINHLQVCHDKTLEMQNNKEIYNYNIT